MKVHFLTENALEALRVNLQGNLRHYADESNEWIYQYFVDENPFMEYKQEFPDFQLEYNPNEELEQLDVNNAITLYSAMQSLTDSQATDERLWAGMCHSDFWPFLRARWQEFDSHLLKDTIIKSRYFFAQGKKRSLITNSLSRLWWVGRLTYDEKRSNPFELTQYMNGLMTSARVPLFSNNYTSNKQILIGLLSAIHHLEVEGFFVRNKKRIMIEATKYLNILGGSYILDYFTSEEIEERVIKYMKSL